jgi:hypothetical protein
MADTLWLIEYYIVGPNGETGWDIRFAWVKAATRLDAKVKLAKADKKFDATIQIGDHAEKFELVGVTPLDLTEG